MTSSRVGEEWRPYFQAAELSWCIPDQIDANSFLRHAKSEWITRMLHHTHQSPSAGTRVLEAGCGTAMYALTLAAMGFSVDAFDYNAEALVFARKLEAKARQVNPGLQIQIQRGDLLHVDAPSNRYDLVFNQAVLDYFCDEAERRQALAEMVRVTRPGGWVAVIVQHTGHPFLGLWERMGWRGYTEQPPVALQTPARLARELRDAGLANVIVDGIYPWKAFFFYPEWYRRWKLAENAVYILGRALDRMIPLPRSLRSQLAIQFLAVGLKP